VAARIPVVATAFPHAVELLTDGPGLLVPHRKPVALAAAIRRIVTKPALAATLLERNGHAGPALRWPAVAQRYHHLAATLVTAGARPVAVAGP
jgi:glycosyltransferase involved in cell wall biosynthesis